MRTKVCEWIKRGDTFRRGGDYYRKNNVWANIWAIFCKWKSLDVHCENALKKNSLNITILNTKQINTMWSEHHGRGVKLIIGSIFVFGGGVWWGIISGGGTHFVSTVSGVNVRLLQQHWTAHAYKNLCQNPKPRFRSANSKYYHELIPKTGKLKIIACRCQRFEKNVVQTRLGGECWATGVYKAY